MKTWTIGRRVTSGFAALLAITSLLNAFVYSRLAAIQKNTDLILGDCLPGVYHIGLLQNSVRNSEERVYRHILSQDTNEMARISDEMAASREEVGAIFADYEKTITRAEDRSLFEKIKALRPEYLQVRDAVLDLSFSGKKKEAADMARSELEPFFDKYMAAVQAEVEFNKKSADTYSPVTYAAVHNAKSGLGWGILAALAVGMGMSVFLTRGTGRILSGVAGEIQSGADEVASAAGQVRSVSQTLASGASEQAASIEETSSSLEEMSSLTKRNAENAHKANDLAKQARSAADQGAADMQSMSSAMTAIQDSSNDIAKIIKTIDEIAFQTNILALNAAVEAARAGEAGMGFAVVADEVRNLAQRSAQAAKETAAKIEAAIDKTHLGVEVSAKVVQSLNEIVAKVRIVDELVAEVAGASSEQSQGISQINIAVGEMDKITQSGAATAEEAAAAASEMTAQAESMKHAVDGLLKLVGGGGGHAVAGAVAPPRAKPAKPDTRPLAHANGNGRARASSLGSKTNGRHEIPLEDDFKDF